MTSQVANRAKQTTECVKVLARYKIITIQAGEARYYTRAYTRRIIGPDLHRTSKAVAVTPGKARSHHGGVEELKWNTARITGFVV